MLQQRGVDVSTPETMESQLFDITRFDKVFVYLTNRARITTNDIAWTTKNTKESGGDLSIVVVPIPPSAAILSAVRAVADKFQLFHVGQLQFDLTTHRKIPPHRILNAEEREAFMAKYHVKDPSSQMPLIDSQDMMARWIGAKPGDIVEIIRKSETAGSTPYYRLCVADVTV